MDLINIFIMLLENRVKKTLNGKYGFTSSKILRMLKKEGVYTSIY